MKEKKARVEDACTPRAQLSKRASSRWRRRASAQPRRARQSDRSKDDRQFWRQDRSSAPRGASPPDRDQRRCRRLDRRLRRSSRARARSATTRPNSSTRISLRLASSTRPRSSRSALQNAASVAGLMLTTEALVADIPPRTRSPQRECPGRRRRHGRHGRHGLLAQRSQHKNSKAPEGSSGAFRFRTHRFRDGLALDDIHDRVARLLLDPHYALVCNGQYQPVSDSIRHPDISGNKQRIVINRGHASFELYARWRPRQSGRFLLAWR